MTAVDIARHLKIPQVIVPFYPGITSALGLLTTDLKYDLLRTEFRLSSEIHLDEIRRDIDDLESAAHEQLQRDGVPDDRIRFLRSLIYVHAQAVLWKRQRVIPRSPAILSWSR